MKSNNLVIISGPTAVGKTSLSIKLAKEINGSIISADSMQVYKHMNIGSAKITKEEMDGVKHYLIDILEPENEFNIVTFQKYAKDAIDTISAEGKTPIIVGGTGFYIQALLYNIEFSEESSEDSDYRNELTKMANDNGNEYIHELLKQVDLESYNTIHANDTKRVIRALEYYKQTGEKISEHNKIQQQKTSPYNFKYFVINDNRDLLYENINKRVDMMIDNGLIDEVKKLKERGLSINNISMQGLGYKEILSYLNGEISLEDAIYMIKRDTRHFAKRQITWFKREDDVIWINKDEFEYNESRILEYIKEQLKSAKII